MDRSDFEHLSTDVLILLRKYGLHPNNYGLTLTVETSIFKALAEKQVIANEGVILAGK